MTLKLTWAEAHRWLDRQLVHRTPSHTDLWWKQGGSRWCANPQLSQGRSLPHAVQRLQLHRSLPRTDLQLQLRRTPHTLSISSGWEHPSAASTLGSGRAAPSGTLVTSSGWAGGNGGCSAVPFRGTETGEGTCRAPAAPSHRVVKGAEVGCSLAGLTLGAGMGAVWTSATPMQLRDAGGGDGGVGEEPITQATCLTCQQPAGMSIFYIQTSAG